MDELTPMDELIPMDELTPTDEVTIMDEDTIMDEVTTMDSSVTLTVKYIRVSTKEKNKFSRNQVKRISKFFSYLFINKIY